MDNIVVRKVESYLKPKLRKTIMRPQQECQNLGIKSDNKAQERQTSQQQKVQE